MGIDLGKRTYEVAIVKGGKVTKSNGKTFPEGRRALYKKLRSGDKVALEAGNLAFIMAKEIGAAVEGCEVYVLNPSKLALIYGSMKKTDKEDALKPAHILEDCKEERLPVVPVPSDKELERRKLLAGYRRAGQSRTRMINLLHALFGSRGITTKVRADLATAKSREESIKELEGFERDEADYLAKLISATEERLAELKERMAEDAAGDKEIERLRGIPGVGPLVSFAFTAHIAAERFENAGQVSNHIGLVPKVYMSGDTVRYGRITRRGNGFLRALLVQAAWSMIRSKNGGKLKTLYEHMTAGKGMSKKKAITAVARRMAEMMHTLLKNGTGYEPRPFVPPKKQTEELARKALSA